MIEATRPYSIGMYSHMQEKSSRDELLATPFWRKSNSLYWYGVRLSRLWPTAKFGLVRLVRPNKYDYEVGKEKWPDFVSTFNRQQLMQQYRFIYKHSLQLGWCVKNFVISLEFKRKKNTRTFGKRSHQLHSKHHFQYLCAVHTVCVWCWN